VAAAATAAGMIGVIGEPDAADGRERWSERFEAVMRSLAGESWK